MRRSVDYKRSDRVSELIKQQISEILFKEVNDPRVGWVTITRAKVSDDLKTAVVSFGVLDRTAEVEGIELALQNASGFIHRLLLKRLRMKTVPRLIFKFDRNLDYSSRISSILKGLEDEDG